MKGERILIVEDEKIIAFDLKRRLKAFGYQVLGDCSTGREALEVCEKEPPDLVLMDILLEGELDGIDTARLLMERFRVPTIFLTAYSDEATLERAKASSPLAFILKPFKERELYSTLDIALYKLKADQQLQDQERWSSSILNSVGDGIIALNDDEKIHYLNPSAAALLGKPPQELIGRPLKDHFQLLDENSLRPIVLTEVETDREATFFFGNALLKVGEGTYLHVEGTVSRVRFEKLPIGLVIAVRDNTQLRRISEKLEFQSRHDLLTGLLNRREFAAKLAETQASKVKNGLFCSMLYLDLDQFRLVNETCGHVAGDELLRETADLLRLALDSQTTNLARLGADEFGLIFEECSLETALEKTWIIKHSLNNFEFSWQNTVFKIKASMGLVPIESEDFDVKKILGAADDAAALAKEEGGNRIKVYEGQEDSFQKRRGEMTWVSRLTRALESEEFVLYQQAIVPVDPASENKTKLEVLLRLRGPGGSLIYPGDFIPAAERYNLMPQIDRWVVRTAANYLNLNRQAGKTSPPLSVNLSGESITDPNLVSFIKYELKKNSIAPGDLCFEITETASIAHLPQAVALIKELRELGCAFALDDFGSGLSSFAYLKNLPVDTLKIDGAFIKNIDQDPVNFAMVEAIQRICGVMGLKTVAEYVVSESVLETIKKIGIDFAQGYAVAEPQPL